MKSSFLLPFVVTLLATSVASAQTKKKVQPPRPVGVPVAAQPDAKIVVVTPESEKTSYQKFSERLKINYGGTLVLPTLRNVRRGDYDNAAISPEFGLNSDPFSGAVDKSRAGKNKDTWPTNIWSQVSFSYNFGAPMKFIVNPRFMIPLSHPISMNEPERKSLFYLDDMLVGFSGTVFSSADKKFNLSMRPALRLPTSSASRNSNTGSTSGSRFGNRGVGKTTHQIDIGYSPTYDLSKTIQIGLSGAYRRWIIEDQYAQHNRVRVTTAPYIAFAASDSFTFQLTYENIIESDRRPIADNSDRHPLYRDVWQNVILAGSFQVNPKLSVTPSINTFINDNPLSDDSLWVALDIGYAIK